MALRWNTNLNHKFVNAYREQECLWRTDSQQYKDKVARSKAIAAIITDMDMPELTEKDVRQKINSMRSTYLAEVKKVQDSLQMDCDSSNVYIPKLPWFYQMNDFIKYVQVEGKNHNMDHCAKSENTEKVECGIDNFVSDWNSNNSSPPTPSRPISKPPMKRPRINHASRIFAQNRTFNEELGETPVDEFEIFCAHVASQLRLLSLEQSIIAQDEIQSILSKYRLQEIRRHSMQRLSNSDESPPPHDPVQVVLGAPPSSSRSSKFF